MTEIFIAVGVVAGVGIVIGLFLGIAGKLLFVQTDETFQKVRENLPGANCGGCGFSGCDGLAEAIAKGEAKPSKCSQCDAEARAAISAIMGIEDEAGVKQVAVVRCSGSCDKTQFAYDYYGLNDCHRVALVPGRGSKACAYACTGLGSCVKVCTNDAIHIENGRAVVNSDKCGGCGACMRACPNNIIELVPITSQYVVRCKSQEKGKVVREMCAAGCIGCGLCQRVCPTHAISVENNIAHIDYSLCENCGACAAKCPAKVIVKQFEIKVAEPSNEEVNTNE